MRRIISTEIFRDIFRRFLSVILVLGSGLFREEKPFTAIQYSGYFVRFKAIPLGECVSVPTSLVTFESHLDNKKIKRIFAVQTLKIRKS